MYFEPAFWEQRYVEHPELFDWYVQLPIFYEHIKPKLTKDDRILILGAGTSRLPFQLFDLGYHDITCIDFAEGARRGVEKELQTREGIRYVVQDARTMNLTGQEGHFTIVIEKGMLDCVLTNTFEPLTAAKEVINNVKRFLTPHATWFSLSFDGTDRKEILEYCTTYTFIVSDPYKIVPPALDPVPAVMPIFYLYKLEYAIIAPPEDD
ncbi:Endothelin-converting enzyme 1 [Giardia muris]|uniref:Endothelin-converting enzyme 1 n=1 Tax=Giardia muris TaxID=5742 RepID=A0A4Z1SSU2_GIAMU|nr:Endothelin-converting enzyme 1 [Giardia muris]|eukprot:TNJ28065.1 Endothelin-converting enzyme 1 [Giardia muris]